MLHKNANSHLSPTSLLHFVQFLVQFLMHNKRSLYCLYCFPQRIFWYHKICCHFHLVAVVVVVVEGLLNIATLFATVRNSWFKWNFIVSFGATSTKTAMWIIWYSRRFSIFSQLVKCVTQTPSTYAISAFNKPKTCSILQHYRAVKSTHWQ